jgi:drug/metabolite transporter (DMT)-like permease
MRRLHADLLLLLAAAIWGLAFVFQKTAMAHLSECLFIAARGFVASLALAPLAWLEQRRRPANGAMTTARDLLPIGIAGGIAFFLGAIFQQIGLRTTTVANTGFLTGLYVVITPFLMWALTRRPPKTLVWLAVAVSFMGTWLLGGGTVSLSGGAFTVGDLLVAICAVFWAGHMVIVGRSSRLNSPITFTAIQFAVVGTLGLVAAAVSEPLTVAGVMAGLRGAAGSIAYVGLLSSALTFTLLAVAMKHTPTAEAAVIVSLEAVFAALAGAVLLGERLSWIACAGAALILIATLIVQIGTSDDAQSIDATPTQAAPLKRGLMLIGLSGAAIAVAVSYAAWPVCVPLSNISDFRPPIEQRTDTHYFGRVFQQRGAQWYQCKTRIARAFFF